MRRRRFTIAALAAFAAFSAFAPRAGAQERVGDVLEADIQSPHPVTVSYWHRDIEYPGAGFLKVHLASLRVGPEDVVLALNGDGEEVFSHTGPASGGLWLPIVAGEKVALEIWPARGSAPWGLAIDRIGRGYSTAGLFHHPAPESICGSVDWQDPACYASDAGKTAAGGAMGKVTYVTGIGMDACSGSLVSPYGHFLTCNHCISDETTAQTADFYWKYQYSECSAGTALTDSTSQVAHLVKTDDVLDYSLLLISSDDPQNRYGYLTLNTSVPSVGTTMWIAEHPGGGPKKFAVSSDADGGLAKVDAVGLTGGNGTVTGGASDIGYFADTEGGSSGSPVFESAGNTVIALHHFGYDPGLPPCTSTNMNQGVEMALIYPAIESYLNSAPLSAKASADKTSGPPPLAVSFTGSAAGGTSPYTYDWDFGDGSAHASTQNASHTYASAGTFTATLTAHDSASGSASSNVVITVGSGQALAVAAAADATSGAPPLTVHFTGAATGGAPPYTYLWIFGDGSQNSTDQNPVHVYSASGAFRVAFTAKDSAAATATDSHLTITVAQPPVITAVAKLTDPFRLKIAGSNFHQNCTVMINASPVPQTVWKSATHVNAKGGATLKAMLPKGTAVAVTVVNNDDGGVSAPFSYTR